MRLLILPLTLFFCTAAFCATAGELTVIASGVGRSVESASVNARENALRTALAMLLKPDVLEKHERRLRDTALAGNGPHIAEATPLGEAVFVDGGLASVTMRVRIAMPPLERALKNEGILAAALDGESRVARQWTSEESREDAGKIIEEQVRHLPAGVMKASADAASASHRLEGDTMRIDLPVLVEVDPQAYRLFADTVRQSLTRMGMNPRVENLSPAAQQPLAGMKKAVGLPEATGADDVFGLLAVCDLFSPKSSRWTVARVPSPVAAAFDRGSGVRVTVDLLDAADQIVSSRDFDIARDKGAPANIFAYSAFHKSACIAPSLNALSISGGTCAPGGSDKAAMRKTVSFILSMDELRRITKVRCGIANQ